jgi:cysteinyl-tRNA synthetase
MNTRLSFQVSPEMQDKIARMAAESGLTIENLLEDMTARMVKDFEAYKTFEAMAKRGQGEVEKALELLRRS